MRDFLTRAEDRGTFTVEIRIYRHHVSLYSSNRAAIFDNFVISCQQGDAFNGGLGDDKTIKRIFVNVWQCVDGDRVLAENRQFAVAVVQQSPSQHAHVDPEVVTAQPMLDDNFPNT